MQAKKIRIGITQFVAIGLLLPFCSCFTDRIADGDSSDIIMHKKMHRNVVIEFSLNYPDTTAKFKSLHAGCQMSQSDTTCDAFQHTGWASVIEGANEKKIVFFLFDSDSLDKNSHANYDSFVIERKIYTSDEIRNANWKLYF